MKNSPKICRYLDIPIQHINDKILKSMNRGHTRKDIEQIINHFRNEIPDIAIRTTLITGYPGETEEDFKELKDYVKSTKFDRLGVFSYSEEKVTPAGDNLKDDVPQEVKESRKEEILAIQQNISLDLNLDKINKKYKVIIDRIEGEFYAGRTEYDSPEVDNEVLIPIDSADLKPGQYHNVIITDAIEFDLFGTVAV
jgi:ribosomal protein S12 methylthiotransferase